MGNDFVPCKVCTMQHLEFHVQKSFIIDINKLDQNAQEEQKTQVRKVFNAHFCWST